MDPFGPLGYQSAYGNIASAMQAGNARMEYRPVLYGTDGKPVNTDDKDVQSGVDDPIARSHLRQSVRPVKTANMSTVRMKTYPLRVRHGSIPMPWNPKYAHMSRNM